LEEAELFRKFIDVIIWTVDSESTNIGIRSTLYTVQISNEFQLTLRQICTKNDNGSADFLISTTVL